MSFWTNLSHTAYEHGYLDAGGVRTRYIEAGSGPPLVLLHGTGGHLEAYMSNIGELAQHFRTIAFDMIGHGFTDKPDHDYEIPHYVKHLLDVLDALDIERANISGESLGGWVAAQFALDHPDRVAKIALNTAGGLTADAAVMERLKSLSMAAVENLSRETVRKRLEWLMYDPGNVTEELIDTRYAIYAQPGFLRTMEHIMCLQELPIRQRNMLHDDDLKTIAAPALVVWTSHDPTGAVEVGERFVRDIPRSRLVVLERCGHWPQYEAAGEFNRLLLEFFAPAG
jgi:2-hydroxy-6-oxonona-2,4-dienedioate hydrolase